MLSPVAPENPAHFCVCGQRRRPCWVSATAAHSGAVAFCAHRGDPKCQPNTITGCGLGGIPRRACGCCSAKANGREAPAGWMQRSCVGLTTPPTDPRMFWSDVQAHTARYPVEAPHGALRERGDIPQQRRLLPPPQAPGGRYRAAGHRDGLQPEKDRQPRLPIKARGRPHRRDRRGLSEPETGAGPFWTKVATPFPSFPRRTTSIGRAGLRVDRY